MASACTLGSPGELSCLLSLPHSVFVTVVCDLASPVLGESSGDSHVSQDGTRVKNTLVPHLMYLVDSILNASLHSALIDLIFSSIPLMETYLGK